jgi:hypothetical protein
MSKLNKKIPIFCSEYNSFLENYRYFIQKSDKSLLEDIANLKHGDIIIRSNRKYNNCRIMLNDVVSDYFVIVGHSKSETTDCFIVDFWFEPLQEQCKSRITSKTLFNLMKNSYVSGTEIYCELYFKKVGNAYFLTFDGD